MLDSEACRAFQGMPTPSGSIRKDRPDGPDAVFPPHEMRVRTRVPFGDDDQGDRDAQCSDSPTRGGSRSRRIAAAVSDGPDFAPSFEGTCGRLLLEARVVSLPFTPSAATTAALQAAIDAGRRWRPLDEDLERLEGFAHEVISLLERRREP